MHLDHRQKERANLQQCSLFECGLSNAAAGSLAGVGDSGRGMLEHSIQYTSIASTTTQVYITTLTLQSSPKELSFPSFPRTVSPSLHLSKACGGARVVRHAGVVGGSDRNLTHSNIDSSVRVHIIGCCLYVVVLFCNRNSVC